MIRIDRHNLVHLPGSLHERPVEASGGSSRQRDEQRGVGVVFFVRCLYSVDVIKSAKGAYLEISSSSKH